MILWFFYVCGLEEIIDNHSEFEAHVLMLGNKVFLHNTMHKAHPTVSAFDKTKAALELQSRIVASPLVFVASVLTHELLVNERHDGTFAVICFDLLDEPMVFGRKRLRFFLGRASFLRRNRFGVAATVSVCLGTPLRVTSLGWRDVRLILSTTAKFQLRPRLGFTA